MNKYIITNKNKSKGLSPSEFIEYGNNYIKDIEIKDYEVKPTYFKNLYYKLIEKLYPKNSDEIYKFSLKLQNGQDFCRSNITASIIKRDKKKFEHKHLLFFSDFDIRRLIASGHVLIDGTFSFSKGFSQTIIVMYLDPIILKMIPSLFCIINNKSYEPYKYVFTDLSTKINISDKTKLNLLTFTSDFEKALYTGFMMFLKIYALILNILGVYFIICKI